MMNAYSQQKLIATKKYKKIYDLHLPNIASLTENSPRIDEGQKTKTKHRVTKTEHENAAFQPI